MVTRSSPSPRPAGRMDSKGGYTLVELMVTVAILGIIGSVGSLITTKIFQAQMMSEAMLNIQTNAFATFDVVNKLLRQAQGSSIVIDQYDANEPPWSRVTFTIPNNPKSFTFYQKGQTLYIGNVPTFNNLLSLYFSYPKTSDAQLINVSMTYQQSTGSGRSKALQLYIQNLTIQN